MIDETRPVGVYLVDTLNDAGDPQELRAHSVVMEDNYVVVRWFGEDEQVEIIPWHRVSSLMGAYDPEEDQ